MAVQGLGWLLFATSIASIIWLIIQVAAGFAYCVRCWALMTSSFFLSAQMVSRQSSCQRFPCMSESMAARPLSPVCS